MGCPRLIIDVFLVIVLICFVFSVFYFINGSLEMIPTPEQQEKAKIAALFLSIIFAATEVALLLLRLKISRKIDRK